MASTTKAVSRSLLFGFLACAAFSVVAAAEQAHPTQNVTVLKVNNGQEVLVEINGE